MLFCGEFFPGVLLKEQALTVIGPPAQANPYRRGTICGELSQGSAPSVSTGKDLERTVWHWFERI